MTTMSQLAVERAERDLKEAQADLRTAEAEARYLRDRVKRLQGDLDEAIALRDTMPEPPEEGSVVTFALKLGAAPRTYTYAAIRAGGRWFTTGSTCPTTGYTWTQLITWMRENTIVTGPTEVK